MPIGLNYIDHRLEFLKAGLRDARLLGDMLRPQSEAANFASRYRPWYLACALEEGNEYSGRSAGRSSSKHALQPHRHEIHRRRAD